MPVGLIRSAKQLFAMVTLALAFAILGLAQDAMAQPAQPSVTITGPSDRNEGNSGTTSFPYTLNLSAPAPAGGLNVTVFVGGSASSGSDYTPPPTTVFFAAGTTTTTFPISVIGDTLAEPDETLTVFVSPGFGYQLGATSTASATILNDDGPIPTVTISAPAAQNEGNSGTTNFVFTVTSSVAAPAGGLAVNASVSGTATPGVDYNTPPTTAVIPAGQTTGSFTVSVVGDTVPEANDTLQVSLFAGTGYVIGSPGSATTTILNDDGAAPIVTISGPGSLSEGNSGTTNFVFTVTSSSAAPTGGLLVQLTFGSGTASIGSDFNFPFSTSVSIPAGQTSATYTVPVIGDTVAEPDETLVVGIATSNSGLYQVGVPGSATATILNDDGALPVITISAPANQNEGNSGTSDRVFTVSSTVAAPPGGLSVNLSVSGGTATGGSDYSFPPPSVVIPAGQTSVAYPVAVIGDTIVEPDETLTVQVAASFLGAYQIGSPSTATTTILNDDGALPTVTISGPAPQNEGNSGTTNFVFTVTTSAPAPTGGLTVGLSVGGGTATAPSDFNIPPTSVTIPSGQTTATFNIAVVGDTVAEPNETIVVTLTPSGGYQLGSPSSATATILNDDGVLRTLSIGNVSQNEGNSGTTNFVFTPQLDVAAGPGGVSFSITLSPISASLGSDYTAPATLNYTIPEGQTSTAVTIPVIGDTVPEPNETFSVALGSVSGATLGTSTATGTILNDDGPMPTVSINNVTQNEGNTGTSNFVFTVTSSAPAPTGGIAVTVNLVGVTATLGTDLNFLTAGTYTIPPGQTTVTIPVSVIGDTTQEPDETFTVTLLSATNANLGSPAVGTGTIVNDDTGATPVLTINDVTVVEGNTGTTNAVFNVSLSSPAPPGGVSYSVQTGDGTATAPGDYTAVNLTGQVIAAGQSTATVTVPVVGDTLLEPNENFFVNVTGVIGATVGDGQGVGTITNDDAPMLPAPTLSLSDVTLLEGNSGTTTFTFVATLSSPAVGEVTFNVSTENGTATAPSDFTALVGQVFTIAPGQTSVNIPVQVISDTVVEANEVFTLRINTSGVVGVSSIIKATGTGTITNDDSPPELSVSDVTVVEGNSGSTNAVFTISLSRAAPAGGISFDVGTANDTAIAGQDYTAVSLSGLTIAAGSTSTTVSVPVLGDTTFEPNETFFLRVLSAVGVVIQDGEGRATITNDDPLPGISVADVTVVEGNTGTTDAVFTVTLSTPAPGGGVTFTPVTRTTGFMPPAGAGTASAGTDFVALNGPTVVIPAGQTSTTVRVAVTGDATFEAAEVFGLELTGLVSATATRTLALATITNDDTPPTLSIGDAQGNEGTDSNNSLTFTISLSEVSGLPVQATVSTASGTATQGIDFVALTSTPIIIAPGSRTATVQVVTLGDDVEEANENFTVTVTPVSGATAGTPMTGTGTIVNDDLDLVITPATLGTAQVGVAFNQAFDVSNGTGPYGFVLVGTLPAGLTFTDPGVISGTPTEGGTFQLEMLAADSSDPSIGGPFVGTRSYTLVVVPATIVLPAVTLPSTVQGTAYSATLQPATGGTPGYTYQLTGGALPAGITFNAATLSLSGTPTEIGTFSFTVTATDSSTGTGPYSGTRTYSIQVAERPPVAANSALTVDYGSAATVVPLSLSGGTATSVAVVTAAANGTVTVDGVTIRYQPNVGFGGSDSFTYSASNSGGTSAPATVSVTVLPPVLTVTTTGALTGSVGTPYSLTFEFTGGAAPFTGYAVTGLPAGLSVTASTPRSVTVSGTPTQAGSFTLEATARDSSTGAGPYTARGSAAVTIAAPVLALAPATTSFTATYVTPFSQAFTATGGTGSFSYALTGTVPRGLSFANGTLSGTPTQSGTFNFTVTATDTVATGAGAPFRVSRDYTITIAAPVITATPTALPAATAGRAYSASLIGSGGAAPYSFTLASGSLPPGVTLSPAGALSGTPTSSGTFAFVVRVSDTNGESGTVSVSVTVNAPVLSITPASLPDARQGIAYSQTFVASGGNAPYTFAVSAGALPAGLTLNATTGVLSGTPTGSGPATFAITATDSTGGTPGRGTVTYTLQVTPRPDPALDPEVRSLTQTQVVSARRLSEVQVGNFRRRLDNMRGGHGSGGGGSAGGFQNGITIAAMDRCPPQINPWVVSVCQRSEGMPGLMGLSGNGSSQGLGAQDTGGSAGGSSGGGTGGRPWTVWTGGTIRYGELDAATGLVRQEFEAEGLSLGADYRFSPTFAAGVGIGYGSDTVDVGTNGSRSRAEAWTLTVYGSHLLSDGFYADWVAGYQSLDFDLRRFVTATGGTIVSSRSGSQLFLSASAGADLDRGGWRISPYGRLDITRGTLDAYSEVSTSLFALSFQEQDIHSTALGVGSTFEYIHDFQGGTFAPRFSVQYMYDLDWNGDARLTYVDRVTGPFSTFSLTGLSRSQFELGAGFEVRWGEELALEIEYLNRIASGVAADHSFRFGARYAF